LVSLTGDLSDEQRESLLKVAGKCPLHKLMTEVTTEIETVWL
jgi:putative redox protein